MEWNDKEEDYLKKLHFETFQLYKYFNKKNIQYISTHKKYNIPILCLSAINSLVAVILPQFVEQEFVSIVNALLSAGTGILSSVLLYFKINERISLTHQISVSLRHLSLKIAKELSIKKELRSQSGIDFLNECFNQYLSIMEIALPIDKNLRPYLCLDDLENINIDDLSSIGSLSTPKNKEKSDIENQIEQSSKKHLHVKTFDLLHDA